MNEHADTPAEVQPVLEALGISKRFGSTQALLDVGLSLQPGRCLGLVGRNGAGKSTLISILCGLQSADAGQVRFSGEPAPPLSDIAAWRSRIATVFQHSMVVPQLTVAENIFLGDPPGRGGGLVSWRTMRAESRRVMHEWGFDVDPDVECGALTVEQRQIVEIAGALTRGTRVLLLDEPTAALERGGVRRLFDRVRALAASGVAVLYISHHLEEVFEICDDVTVLRDGKAVLTAPTSTLSEEQLVGAMVGGVEPVTSRQGVKAAESRRHTASGEQVLVVEDVVAESARGALDGISLTVHAGERLGVTGLLGAGVATLGQVIVGTHRYQSGRVTLDGVELPPGRPDKALSAGVGYVPEDRWLEGFVGLLGCGENMTMSIAGRLANRFGIITPAARARAARPLAERLSLVSRGLDQPVQELSGGNQQKVAVARAVASRPKLIVAITPTRGVDVASKELLLSALAELTAGSGASLLLASDELDDLRICDRVVVVVRGRVFAEFMDPPFDDEELIAATEGLTAVGGQ